MKYDNLNEAEQEAERFLKRVKELKTARTNDGLALKGVMYGTPNEQGSVKRASMDLTRALSKLRNDKD